MKIIQELYDLKTVCVGGMQIWFFWILENCWNYKKIIEFSQESTILGKLQWSCGKLEPKLLKLGQFWSGEICKLLCTLNVTTPCICPRNRKPFLKQQILFPSTRGTS